MLMNYVTTRAPKPLNTEGIPWCRIFHTIGHKSEEIMYLQKIVSSPTSLYYKFCRSTSHGEKYCRALQLPQERTMDTYLMKNDEKIQVE